MERNAPKNLLNQAVQFIWGFGSTLVSVPAVLAAGYKVFGKKNFKEESFRLFKSSKVIGFSAAMGVLGALFERFIQHHDRQDQSLARYDREELDALREHVRAEGLTISYDGKTTLQKMDKNGDFHPISVTELEDGSVLVKPTKKVVHSMRGLHADKIVAEKAAAAEVTPAK